MPALFVREPFGFGAMKPATAAAAPLRNGVALTDDPDRHLRDKIIAVLFTAPGERVNAPRFGAGLNRATFEGLNPLTVTAIEYRVTEGLRRDVGDEIIVEGIDISTEPAAGELLLVITYRRREDRIARTLRIEL
ncbi:GPW/gp25 family protein [Bradyrhizobium sp.]|jgi:phage baseplate assembly protein W|uniref:GPW/gp25 family protein n=1 Tax=Bradyrhizobium sp. TaxID=376 RepID=UPI002E0871D7|nr:GPW/gp25 family protein [Bradyrhizobium sp.]